ncbi:hypothetical protein M758_11G111700 [Ceratodon purpureus]|nr:hypothetical protein M758_11G111700 [Ceratodon purpureus]
MFLPSNQSTRGNHLHNTSSLQLVRDHPTKYSQNGTHSQKVPLPHNAPIFFHHVQTISTCLLHTLAHVLRESQSKRQLGATNYAKPEYLDPHPNFNRSQDPTSPCIT